MQILRRIADLTEEASMATFMLCCILLTFFAASFAFGFVVSQPPLDSAEQESVYRVLESINSDVPWRTLFPDDFCISAPHGVVCEYFSDTSPPSSSSAVVTPHITELNFGYVSDYSTNPPCNSNSTLDPSLFYPLTHLRKLFFYKCFTVKKIPFPDFSPLLSSRSSLEQLIFIENPALYGSMGDNLRNLSSLRRFVLTGSKVSGEIPCGFAELTNLEQLSLSGNKFEGEISADFFQNFKKLKILDLSENGFRGKFPESVGNLTELLKIDMSFNRFSVKIPENLKNLQRLEFLDLSYNNFGNYGVPLFLGEMKSLKEVYLSGNFLGGQIPEIWENLGGILGIGLSKTGLVGNIPASMGANMRNVCYLGLDNNKLEGTVPKEFGELKFVRELNLENNNLVGKVPFSAVFVSKLGKKLKLKGNLDLCIDHGSSPKVDSSLEHLKLCRKMEIPKTALFDPSQGSSYPRLQVSYVLMFIGLSIILS